MIKESNFVAFLSPREYFKAEIFIKNRILKNMGEIGATIAQNGEQNEACVWMEKISTKPGIDYFHSF